MCRRRNLDECHEPDRPQKSTSRARCKTLCSVLKTRREKDRSQGRAVQPCTDASGACSNNGMVWAGPAIGRPLSPRRNVFNIRDAPVDHVELNVHGHPLSFCHCSVRRAHLHYWPHRDLLLPTRQSLLSKSVWHSCSGISPTTAQLISIPPCLRCSTLWGRERKFKVSSWSPRRRVTLATQLPTTKWESIASKIGSCRCVPAPIQFAVITCLTIGNYTDS